MTTLAPSLARRRAVSAPIPLAPPVITATFPACRCSVIATPSELVSRRCRSSGPADGVGAGKGLRHLVERHRIRELERAVGEAPRAVLAALVLVVVADEGMDRGLL